MAEIEMLGPVSVWEDRGVARSGTLPNDWYTSRDLFDIEMKTLFRDVWTCVGQTEQVAHPGQYFTTTVANEEVVVVRDGTGTLRALSNTCLHRAGPVAIGTGTRKAFQCPYHGWIYELDGRVKNANGMDGTEDFDTDTMRLPEFRVGTWGPSIWVTLSDVAPPLEEWLGDITPRLQNYNVDQLEFAGGRRWEVDCSWKMYMDNFMEGYHIPFIHPGLTQGLSPSIYTYKLGKYTNEQYGAEPHPRGPGSRIAGILGSVNEFRKIKPPMPDLDAKERVGYYFHWVFPLTTINFTPDGILIFQISPLGPERCETRFTWWFPPARSFQDKLLQAAVVNFGHLVNTEDYHICEYAQRGMRSGVYRQGRYAAEQEMCLHHFHQLLTDHMRPHLKEWQAKHEPPDFTPIHSNHNGDASRNGHPTTSSIAQ